MRGQCGAMIVTGEREFAQCILPEGHHSDHAYGAANAVPPVDPPASPPHDPANPLNVQEGGSHYKGMEIQPVVFIHANGIGFMEGNVIKYVARHRAKNGAADLRKARHYIDLLLKLEYGE